MQTRIGGTVKRLVVQNGYGFIVGDDGVDYFFHRRDLVPTIGISYPSNTCLCNHSIFAHEELGQERGVCQDPKCQCKAYIRRPSPKAIYPGCRVEFLPSHDDKGTRAFLVSLEGADVI